MTSLTVSSSHQILLRACCADDDGLEAALADVERTNAIDNADYHGAELFPLLFRRLERSGESVPQNDQLTVAYKRTWQRNQLLLHRARPVFEHLAQRGEPFTVLKGGAMMSSYYLKDMGVRPMGDIDFMVGPAAVGPLAEWMLSNRWSLASNIWSLPETELAHHAIDFVSDNGGALDVHRELLHSGRNPEIDRALMTSAIDAVLGNVPVRVPSPTDQMLHTLAHAKPVGVRHLADAIMLVRIHGDLIDWSELIELCRSRRCIAPVIESIQMLRQVEPAIIPGNVAAELSAISRHWADFCFSGRPVEGRSDVARHFAANVRHRTRGHRAGDVLKITLLLARRKAESSDSGSVAAKLRALAVHRPTSASGEPGDS